MYSELVTSEDWNCRVSHLQSRSDKEAIKNVFGVPWRMTEGRWTGCRPEIRVDPIPIPPLPFEGSPFVIVFLSQSRFRRFPWCLVVCGVDRSSFVEFPPVNGAEDRSKGGRWQTQKKGMDGRARTDGRASCQSCYY